MVDGVRLRLLEEVGSLIHALDATAGVRHVSKLRKVGGGPQLPPAVDFLAQGPEELFLRWLVDGLLPLLEARRGEAGVLALRDGRRLRAERGHCCHWSDIAFTRLE